MGKILYSGKGEKNGQGRGMCFTDRGESSDEENSGKEVFSGHHC